MANYLNTPPRISRTLTEAIYDFVDLFGVSELDAITDLLTGETSIEDFISQVEDDVRLESAP